MEASRKLNGSNPVSTLASGAASKMLAVQPDRVLCTLALRGNASAFEVLYTRYHRSIYAFIYHLLGRGANAEDAEDLAQDTFGSAFDKLEARRESGSFKAWLYTIARNRTFDHIKSDKSNPSNELDTELEADAGASAELTAEQRAQMLWLVGALHELPERQRQALVMRELGGMSYDEIATSIDATVPSVKQLINRARGTVTQAASLAGYSPRNLDKSLQAIAPLLPIAAASTTLAAFGIGSGSAAGVSAGVGGFSAAAKVATVAATVAVVGGGAAGVTEVTHHEGSHSQPATAVVTTTSKHEDNASSSPSSPQGTTFAYRTFGYEGGGSDGSHGAVYYNVPPKRGGDQPKSIAPGPVGLDDQGQLHGAPATPQAPGTNNLVDPGTGPAELPTSSPTPSNRPSSGPSSQGNSDDSVSLPDYSHAIPQAEAPPEQPGDEEDQEDETEAPVVAQPSEDPPAAGGPDESAETPVTDDGAEAAAPPSDQ